MLDPAVEFGRLVEDAFTRARAAAARCHAIEDAHAGEQLSGQPAIDKSIPCLKVVPFEDGRQVTRRDIEMLLDPWQREARLAWWDAEAARISRRGEETGYAAASEASDRLMDAAVALQSQLANVPATTLQGVMVLIGAIVNIRLADYPADYRGTDLVSADRIALRVFSDLQCLIAKMELHAA